MKKCKQSAHARYELTEEKCTGVNAGEPRRSLWRPFALEQCRQVRARWPPPARALHLRTSRTTQRGSLPPKLLSMDWFPPKLSSARAKRSRLQCKAHQETDSKE